MRIHRIALRDFRGVGTADVRLAPVGVTVVQGPNEAGKSSIVDAIDMLLADPDSSTRARVKAAQPVGRDVGPWVEMEFETGPYRLTYSKQWVKGVVTELHVHAPAPEQLTGRAAHDRVVEILGETMDTALFAALRHQQGLPLDQADLAPSSSLARALDIAAGGSGAGDEDTALMDAVDAERQRWTTPGGSPNKALLQLRDSSAQAREHASAQQARLDVLEARIDEHRGLERDIRASLEQEPDLVRRRDACDADLAAVAEREQAVRDLDRAAEAAEQAAQVAQHALAARRALLKAVADDEGRLAVLEEAMQAAGAEMGAAEQQLRDAQGTVADAVTAVRAADTRLAAASAAADRLRDDFDLEFLLERRQAVREAEERLAAAEEFLADCTIDAELMQAIEDAAVAHAVAAGRLADSGAPLRLAADGDVVVEAGEQHHALHAGDEVDLHLLPGDELRLPGVARIRLRDHAAAAVEEDRRAAAHLASLLARAGLGEGEGVGHARALERARIEHERAADEARQARGRALYDLTPDEMDAKIARARERAQAHAPGAGEGAPESLDQAMAQVARCEAARDDARRAEDTARGRQRQAEARVGIARAALAEQQGRMQAEKARLEDDRASLEAARAHQPDHALEQAADGSAGEARDARARHREQADALAGDDPDTLRELARNARTALARLQDDRATLALAAERLLGEIGQAGEEGLADQVAVADESARAAEADLARAERQAAAANLLHEVMSRHLDQARRAYVGPFRERVERLARMVFGPGTTVEIDHASLRVASRTQGGVTVPYDALSGGAREQLAVIGRLAAASLASADGGAPVIIDDAMGYSDAARLQGLGAALAAAGRDAQVIVLTCMPDRQAGIGAATVVRLPGAGVPGAGVGQPADPAAGGEVA